MKKYKHIFFDLDNTLWDFSTNSRESLKDIYDNYFFEKEFKSFENFFSIYEEENTKLWNKYREGNISKETLSVRRFKFASDARLKPSDLTPFILNSEYLANSTQKTKIIKGARNILNYLKKKEYNIHIITDGFFEVQVIKLRNSKLSSHISSVITAEEIGYLKPQKELFEFALETCETNTEESIMIGDSYDNDILGAKNIGMDQIFFNPNNFNIENNLATYTISSLEEIKKIL